MKHLKIPEPHLQTAASSAMRCAWRASRHKVWGALALFETKGNPTLKTLLAVIKSVGMRMSVEPENLVHAQAKSVAGQDPKPNSGVLILQHCADVGRDNVAAADGYDGAYVKL